MQLITPRLLLRNWKDGDRELFHFINSDEQVMKFFPFRRSREESDQLMEWLRADIDENGFGFAAVEIRETGETAGFAGISRPRLSPVFPDDTIEIGWRLAGRWWGKGIATEAARAWLRHGFENLHLPEIVSFAVHDNLRSVAVMERIGMRRERSRDFLHPRVPDVLPHLKYHVTCAISRRDWEAGAHS